MAWHRAILCAHIQYRLDSTRCLLCLEFAEWRVGGSSLCCRSVQLSVAPPIGSTYNSVRSQDSGTFREPKSDYSELRAVNTENWCVSR